MRTRINRNKDRHTYAGALNKLVDVFAELPKACQACLIGLGLLFGVSAFWLTTLLYLAHA
jgi:hypothetical protein